MTLRSNFRYNDNKPKEYYNEQVRTRNGIYQRTDSILSGVYVSFGDGGLIYIDELGPIDCSRAPLYGCRFSEVLDATVTINVDNRDKS